METLADLISFISLSLSNSNQLLYSTDFDNLYLQLGILDQDTFSVSIFEYCNSESTKRVILTRIFPIVSSSSSTLEEPVRVIEERKEYIVNQVREGVNKNINY